MWVFALAALAAMAACAPGGGADEGTNVTTDGRYAFYRDMGAAREADAASGSRRIFGGDAAELAEFPRVVALLDRYWAARCSGTAVAPHWVLTAAHCVTSRLAYVKYNTRRPASLDGDFVPVHYLYRHPKFEVEQTEGPAADVTLLHHDVGLVRTRNVMHLRATLPADLYADFKLYNAMTIPEAEVQVLGFGRTERSVLGEELFAARLQLAACGRGDWLHVVCGAARGAARGVCSGDSGGPVLYRAHQVGVTSMGPVECARAGSTPPPGATSVFTALFPYADVVNATIADTEAALRMTRLSRAPPAPLAAPLPLAAVLVLALPLPDR